mmetsp:Transcript_15912/g.52122  ORF Transcript_15912/g.52122 Transcript_15912/m.52122 type:complete len:85 (-) Transcript_15912:74-328(-)
MRHFTTAEADRNFGFITTFKKATQVAQFDLVIAFISARAKFNLLDLNLLLFFLLLFLSFTFFEEEFAIVHNFTDWRLGIRTDFY